MTSQCQDHAAESARAEYMKEAERLLSEYGDAVSDAVVFAQDPAGYSMRMEEATRAAMLAHIQRGAVPDGWRLVPKEPTPEMLAGGWGYWLNVMAPGKQRDTAAKEYTAMLAAAPSPDQFRGAAKMVPAPAEVPMPEPDTHCYDDDEQRDVWSRTYQMLTYGDAREAAGYARGLAEAGRDAERLDCIERNARCDPKMDGQHVWWPTNFSHRLIGPTLRDAIDAALRGEVKP